MTSTCKDYEFIGDRYVNVDDPDSTLGERMWYDRDIDRKNTPTECVICIEAENEMYTKYAHPKAHLEAHNEATTNAEILALKEMVMEEYIDYYTFYYGREYRKIYKNLCKKYKQEYSVVVLERKYGQTAMICQHHNECIQYHYELK